MHVRVEAGMFKKTKNKKIFLNILATTKHRSSIKRKLMTLPVQFVVYILCFLHNTDDKNKVSCELMNYYCKDLQRIHKEPQWKNIKGK